MDRGYVPQGRSQQDISQSKTHAQKAEVCAGYLLALSGTKLSWLRTVA